MDGVNSDAHYYNLTTISKQYEVLDRRHLVTMHTAGLLARRPWLATEMGERVCLEC